MTGEYRTSFEVVFREHFSDIYGYVAFRLAPQAADAQDITQDVFVAGFTLRFNGSARSPVAKSPTTSNNGGRTFRLKS